MMSAIEKLADRERPLRRRCVVCPWCSVQCSVPHGMPLGDVGCASCLGRLVAPSTPDRGVPSALATLAEWWDKASAPGSGYGGVQCPHCASTCIVEVGGAARTGCVMCLRPLGSSPLIRTDLVSPHAGRVPGGRSADEERHGFVDRMDLREVLPRVSAGSCLFFPGESL